jgi:hypothetical protein
VVSSQDRQSESLYIIVESMHEVLLNEFGDTDVFQESVDGTGRVIKQRGRNRRLRGYSTPTVLASLLDPRIKGNGIPTNHLPRAFELLLNDLVKCADRKKYQHTSSDSPVPIDLEERVDDQGEENYNLFNFADREQSTVSAQSAMRTDSEIEDLIKSDMQSEITRYKARALRRSEDPLKWWKSNGSDFPNLSKAARKYLCVPASSASVERLFSHAGKTIAADRANLEPYYASELVFLRVAWEKIDAIEEKYKKEGKVL